MFKEANPGRTEADPSVGDPALASDAAVGRADAFDTSLRQIKLSSYSQETSAQRNAFLFSQDLIKA